MDPLPKQVDVRKLVYQKATITARQPLASFSRFGEMLAGDEESRQGDVNIQLEFGLGDHGVPTITGAIRAAVTVICQRCLAPMPVALESEFALGVVWTDEQAKSLPKALEPVIVSDEPYDLRELIEDELIISLPRVNFHDDDTCGDQHDYVDRNQQATHTQVVTAQAQTENPFKALERLKSGD